MIFIPEGVQIGYVAARIVKICAAGVIARELQATGTQDSVRVHAQEFRLTWETAYQFGFDSRINSDGPTVVCCGQAQDVKVGEVVVLMLVCRSGSAKLSVALWMCGNEAVSRIDRLGTDTLARIRAPHGITWIGFETRLPKVHNQDAVVETCPAGGTWMTKEVVPPVPEQVSIAYDILYSSDGKQTLTSRFYRRGKDLLEFAFVRAGYKLRQEEDVAMAA
jgi:hypothetical protein